MVSNGNKAAGDVIGDHRLIYPKSDYFGWRDITGEITLRGVAATDPSWEQIGSGPFYAYNFGINDKVWMVYHVPHDIVPNSVIHFHTHWMPDGTNVNPVKWQWDYAYARGFDQEAFGVTGSTTFISAEQAGPGVAYQHMVTETTGIKLDTLDEPDGLIVVCITRVTNGATENTDGIFLLTADVHYQSTDMGTFGKAPDFYGKQT